MKLLRITAVLFCLCGLASAWAENTPQDIENAKKAGLQAAGLVHGLGADNPSSLKSGLADFQATTGYTGVSIAGSSAAGIGATAVANVTVKKSLAFSCEPTSTASPLVIGQLAFLKSSCTLNDVNSVSTVTFLICDNAKTAGVCYSATGSNNGDYTKAVTVQSGQFSSFGSAAVGVNCTLLRCLLTVTDQTSITASDTSMRATAGNTAAGSNYVQGLQTYAVNSGYADSIKESGATIRALKDGAAQVPEKDIGLSLSGNSSCSTVRTCAQEAVSANRFTKTCNRTFPLTTRTTGYSIPRTLTCVITQHLTSKQAIDYSENSCGDTPSYQPPGYTRVGETTPTCTDSEMCTEKTYQQYWVDLSSRTTTSQSASPIPVGGSCDSAANSYTRTTMCTSWFGRTLPDAACIDGAGSAGGDMSAFLGLDYTQQGGCGVCTAPSVNETCYGDPASDPGGADSCATMDTSQCTLSSASPLAASGSLVTAQREVYSCSKEVRQCVKWVAPTPECANADISMGTQYAGSSNNTLDGNFNNAMVAAAQVNGAAKGLEGPQGNQSMPKLFAGEGLGCRRPVGGLGDIFHEDCCRSDLMRPSKGTVIRGGCSMPEVKLSAARRSSYSTYIGTYCSRKVKTWFFSFCLQETSTYCVFPGILPRLIQEQGRAQLSQITSSGGNASVVHQAINYSYYDSTESGQWTPIQLVNGVRVAAWQWPSYCDDPQKIAETQYSGHAINSTGLPAKYCPQVVTTYFAACDIAVGCDDLPAQPTDGALNWTMHAVNPLAVATAAISKFAVVDGACDTAARTCAYNISAWPVGVGGKAVVTKNLNWLLFAVNPDGTKVLGETTADIYRLNNMGDMLFKGYSSGATADGGMPPTVRMTYSNDGGDVWQEVPLPTSSIKSGELSIPGSDVKISGGCDLDSNVCEYRATGTVTVHAKSWGSAESPDCSGFTTGQLAVLDFAKMDLSEWLSTVTAKMPSNNPTDLVGNASAQFQAYNAQFSNGGEGASMSNHSPGTHFARAQPSEGFGPFGASLSIAGYYPEITGDPSRDLPSNRVTRVVVNWGDCGQDEVVPSVGTGAGVGYKGTHYYQAPDEYGCLFSGGNVTHNIQLSVTLGDGSVKTPKLSIENAYAVFPGANGNSVKVSTGVTAPTPQGPPTTKPGQ